MTELFYLFELISYFRINKIKHYFVTLQFVLVKWYPDYCDLLNNTWKQQVLSKDLTSCLHEILHKPFFFLS